MLVAGLLSQLLPTDCDGGGLLDTKDIQNDKPKVTITCMTASPLTTSSMLAIDAVVLQRQRPMDRTALTPASHLSSPVTA